MSLIQWQWAQGDPGVPVVAVAGILVSWLLCCLPGSGQGGTIALETWSWAFR
jgi:hypothetical protein